MSEITGIQPTVSGWATSVDTTAARSSRPASQPAAAPFETVMRSTPSTAARSPEPGNDPAAAMRTQKKKLEAFVMQTFVESMLPENSMSLYGDGTAGRMWRSMLAEQVAESIVDSGRISLLPDDAAVAPTGSGRTTTMPAAMGGKGVNR